MTRVRVILCLVLILFASGTRAQQSPLPCSYVNGHQETLAAAVGANTRSVLWVHRQGKDFPPCLDVLPSKPPYLIVNRDDRNRRFYVFTHDAISGVYSSSTRRNNFVTLDELSRGVENIPAAGPSVGNELPITRFASNVYASENYSDLKLVLSGTLAGILLAIGPHRRTCRRRVPARSLRRRNAWVHTLDADPSLDFCGISSGTSNPRSYRSYCCHGPVDRAPLR